MPDSKPSTGELYSQRIDALEAHLNFKFASLEDKFDKLSNDATRAIDALLETTKAQETRLREVELKQAAAVNGKGQEGRLRAIEIAQATCEEYRVGHRETHIKERGALGTWTALAAIIAGAIGYFDN